MVIDLSWWSITENKLFGMGGYVEFATRMTCMSERDMEVDFELMVHLNCISWVQLGFLIQFRGWNRLEGSVIVVIDCHGHRHFGWH